MSPGSRPRRTGIAGLALLGLLVVLAAVGPSVAGADPDLLVPTAKLEPPSAVHLLGTDQLGRDQLARLAAGATTTLAAALLIVVGALVISMVVGLLAGLLGGVVDVVAMRAVDVLLAVPDLVIALAVLGVLGPGLGNLLIALTVSSWAYLARLARVHVLQARERPDVWAARLAGVGAVRRVTGHIVPGLAARLTVVATLRVGGVVMGFAALSFLGLGAEPGAAEWGAMLAGARLYVVAAPWLALAPAVCIVVTVAAANLCADGLRDGADT